MDSNQAEVRKRAVRGYLQAQVSPSQYYFPHPALQICSIADRFDSAKHEPTDRRFAEYDHDAVWTTVVISGSVDSSPSGDKGASVPGFTTRAMPLDEVHLTRGEQTLKMTAMKSVMDFMSKVIPPMSRGAANGNKG